ncbi:MAG: phosphoribulokinase [Actinobacteria bacterium]|nr:phosphoribulokinase [Actinomycetota bacterium]
MARPVVLGVVGDSGAGKTTLNRGVVRILGGSGQVSYISGDDYHRYGREQRGELGITPLDPAANHLDVLCQHLGHLRASEPILKPNYDHRSGNLGAPSYVRPNPYVVVEGLLNFHTERLRDAHDIRVFLAPPERLRRNWKLTRDCTRRGYTTHQVLAELDRRERDVDTFIAPQRAHADIVVSFMPTDSDDPARLDAHVILRGTLKHPDLSPVLGLEGEGPTLALGEGPTLARGDGEMLLKIPGDMDPDLAAELEEAVWARMSYASRLRASRLGEFTIGTELHRSESLALVQTLLLYHLVSTRATISAGDDPHVWHPPRGTGADSALHA